VTIGPYTPGNRGEEWHAVYEGDALELASAIPDNSIDVVYTDPPYGKEFIHLYGRIAQEAQRILRPAGWLLLMCGGLYLNDIFRMVDGAGLNFYWLYNFAMTGNRSGNVHPGGSRNAVIVRQKRIMAYSKGKAISRTVTYDVMSGDGGDKRFHEWGQDVVSARYYIDCFSKQGDIVLDPFAGGGTTGVACQLIDRQWLLFEQDHASAQGAMQRLEGRTLPMFAGMDWKTRSMLI